MFSDKENINILTSLLVSHGVKRIVVCPGSRNAPLIHNFNECKNIECYPVTDERSAGFYALGMSLATDEPVAVCVTSGTALLNLLPAVAESTYRHHGLIVISADRPSAWIGQLDGQTLVQTGALDSFVSKVVNLPEPHDEEERWFCNRIVNEALLSVVNNGCKSVQINVPISEPLFGFNVASLPYERKIHCVKSQLDTEIFYDKVVKGLLSAEKPMIVIGQINRQSYALHKALKALENRFAVLSEPLSDGTQRLFDLFLSAIDDTHHYEPDFLLYVGDTVVSKRLKHFLRNAEDVRVWAISEDGEVHDTFKHLVGLIEGDSVKALSLLSDTVNNGSTNNFALLWKKCMDCVKKHAYDYVPDYSQLAVVKELELKLGNGANRIQVHYANSTSVRLACIFASHYVWCNRGVNGIEGSVSVAAGHSIVVDGVVFCVTGDLSFFYDQNALWNVNIGKNLRIILMNNYCGGIFYGLKGLRNSAAFGDLVAAKHNTTAQGICVQNNVKYLSAHNISELRYGLETIMEQNTQRPILLEVFTDAEEDKRVMKDFMNYIKTSWKKQENGNL